VRRRIADACGRAVRWAKLERQTKSGRDIRQCRRSALHDSVHPVRIATWRSMSPASASGP
jgi:hypothetical protein